MGSILIAMPRAEDTNRIADIVRRSGLMFDIETCNTSAEVLRIANDREYGVVICGKRLRDTSCTELSEMIPAFFGMIVITSDPSVDFYSEKCVKLMTPFKRSDLISTIEMITSGFCRRKKKTKFVRHERSEEEQKIIDSAKALLMERNGMSEPEAFRYIQKNSMDCSRSLIETAQMILVLNE